MLAMGQVKLHVITTDDWVGLYIDGDLKYEGHSLSHWHLLQEMDRAGLLEGISWSDKSDESFGELEQFGYRFPQSEKELDDIRPDGDN